VLRPLRTAAPWLGLLLCAAAFCCTPRFALADEPAPNPAEAPAPAPPSAEAAPAAAAPAESVAAEPAPAEAPAPEAAAVTDTPDLAALLANPALQPVQRMQLELLQLINQRRADAGIEPLILDERLVASATEHSQDMAARRFCRHGGSDGSNARRRMSRHGYPANNWSGENIICGRKSAAAAMKWWMNSRPHRKNILHRHYSHIGIGIDLNGPWGPMWTLNFADGAADTAHASAFDVTDTSGEAGAPPVPEGEKN
jgi:uncharacterized protein YkwD